MSSFHAPRDPCRIVDSDSEDERDVRIRTFMTNSTRIPTTKIMPRIPPPKIVDWDTSPNLEEPNATPSGRVSSASSSGSFSDPNKEQGPVITTNTLESPPASPAVFNNQSNFDPMMLALENVNSFVNTPIPKDYPLFIQCCLKRDKGGVQGAFFPTFYLHMERPNDSRKIILLAARKAAKINRQSEYMITTNIETLSEKSGGDGYIGRLRELNIAGTEYVLYDHGISPKKSSHKHGNNRENLRRELAAVIYNTNIFGFKGPRQMSAMLPELGHDIRPSKNEDGILDQWKSRRLSYLIPLRNKLPKFNEDTKTYVLQFTENRVAQPSVKNFQMVIETDTHEEHVVMQFGRVDADTFTCDYRYPLSAIQAFGIALSSFDSRLIRE